MRLLNKQLSRRGRAASNEAARMLPMQWQLRRRFEARFNETSTCVKGARDTALETVSATTRNHSSSLDLVEGDKAPLWPEVIALGFLIVKSTQSKVN